LTPKQLDMISGDIDRKDFNGKSSTLQYDVKFVSSLTQLVETNPNKMSEDRIKQTEPEIDDFSILIDRLPLIFAQLDQVDNLA